MSKKSKQAGRSANIAQAKSPQPQKPFPFFALPRELRDKIYEEFCDPKITPCSSWLALSLICKAFAVEFQDTLGSKHALVKVELDKMPKSFVTPFEKEPEMILVTKKVMPLQKHDMMIRFPSADNDSESPRVDRTSSRRTPYLVLVGVDPLARFCKAISVLDEQDYHIRDSVFEVHLYNPRNLAVGFLGARQQSLFRQIQVSCWGFSRVAVHGCKVVNNTHFISRVQGNRWTSKEDFFRTLMTIIHVEAPRLLDQKQHRHAFTLSTTVFQPLLTATSLTGFGHTLTQGPKSSEQVMRLRLSSHQFAAKVGAMLLIDTFEEAARSKDTVPRDHFVEVVYFYGEETHRQALRALRILDTLRMSVKQLAKCRGDLYQYDCEALAVLGRSEEAYTALCASISANPVAGSRSNRIREWRAKEERLRLLSVEMAMSFYGGPLNKVVISQTLAMTGALGPGGLPSSVETDVHSILIDLRKGQPYNVTWLNRGQRCLKY